MKTIETKTKCIFLEQENENYPPYCKNKDYCDKQFNYGYNKYCKDKLKELEGK